MGQEDLPNPCVEAPRKWANSSILGSTQGFARFGRSPAKNAMIPSLSLLLLSLPLLPPVPSPQDKVKPKRTGLPEKVEGEIPIEWADALNWRSVGPACMGGRITDVAVNPDNQSEQWISTATGGLLHTTNNGVTYEHQFSAQRVGSVGAVAVAPSNPKTVWVGTGECNPRNSVSFGNGVYRSLDSGSTWDHMGLEDSFQIAEILVHPEDEATVFVAALGRLWGPNEERGLYRSQDNGESWQQILEVGEDTGVVEIAMQPGQPDVLLCASYERRRDIYDSNDPARKWGPGSALWRSTDGGDSWTRLTAPENTSGLPTVMLGRIGVDYCQSMPNVVFATIETERITQEPENAAWIGVRAVDAEVGARITDVEADSPADEGGLKEDDILLRIADQTLVDWNATTTLLRKHVAGDTVTAEVIRGGEVLSLEFTLGPRPKREGSLEDELGYPRSGPFSIGLGGQEANAQDNQGPEGKEFGGLFRSEDAGLTWQRVNSLNPRPMYYSEVRVDPSNQDNVYVLGTRLWRSSDGGKSFSNDGHDGSVHVDHHALWINPADGNHMILGNDGGIYVTWDRMEHWDHHNHIAIGQFYNVEVGPRENYRVYGGLQDNGSWGGWAQVNNGPGPVNSDWISIGGGDGFVVRVDPENPDLIYYESQNGGMGRRNLATGESGWIRPSGNHDVRTRFNWNTPFILSPHNSAIHTSAGSRVFRSVSRGSGARSISDILTTTERGSGSALAESHFKAGELWVGTDDGGLWHTPDRGVTWIDLWALNTDPEAVNEEVEEPTAEEEIIEEEIEEEELIPEEVIVEDAVEPESAPTPDDPSPSSEDSIGGLWICFATGAGLEDPEDGRFELSLELGAESALSGSMKSDLGNGDIRDGRYNPDDHSFRFAFQGTNLRLDFQGKLEGGTLSGQLSGAGGSFNFEFTGQRPEVPEPAEVTSDPASEQDPEKPAPAPETATESEEDEEEGEDEEEDKPTWADQLQTSSHTLPKKPLKNTIDQFLPGRRYVSQLFASQHDANRIYAAFDGHRSDDDSPYAFRSDDEGRTWVSLTKKLPSSAGPVRALHEDRSNADLLYLGTEFGFFVSINRGKDWTRMNGSNGLPTVPVHDFAQHPTGNDLIVGTHGRSIWILDVGPLREASEDALNARAHLFKPGTAIIRDREPQAANSGTRRFVGENPTRGAAIYYTLNKRGRDVTLHIEANDGTVVQTLDPSNERGLHRMTWNLRLASSNASGRGSGRRRFQRGRQATPGTYRIVLKESGQRYEQTLEVRNAKSE